MSTVSPDSVHVQYRPKGFVHLCSNFSFVLVCVAVLAAAVSAPVVRRGDGAEYVLATESLYYDHDLVYDERVDLARPGLHRPAGLADIPAGLFVLKGTDGRSRYGLHSFYYPLAAVPFFALFGHIGFLVLGKLL